MNSQSGSYINGPRRLCAEVSNESLKKQGMFNVHPPSPNCNSLRKILGHASSLILVVILSGNAVPTGRVARWATRRLVVTSYVGGR